MWTRILWALGLVWIGLSFLLSNFFSYYINLFLQANDPTGGKALSLLPYLFGIGLISLGFLVWFWPWIRRKFFGQTTIPTKVVLDYPAQGPPVAGEVQNIHYWYSLLNQLTVFVGGQPHSATVTNLFLVFEEATPFKQIVAIGETMQLPQYEVKSSNQRHAVLAFSGPIPVGRMRVELL